MNDEIESFEWTNGGLYLEPHENCVDNLICVEFSIKSCGAKLPISYCPAVYASPSGTRSLNSKLEIAVTSPRLVIVST